MPRNRLAHRFRRVKERIVGRKAWTGQYDEDTGELLTDPMVDGNPNRLWIHFRNDRSSVAAWNNGRFSVRPDVAGLPVRVAKNDDGEWEIVGGSARFLDRMLGDAATTMLIPQIIGELLRVLIPGRFIKEARIHVDPDGDPFDILAHPFFYRDDNGTVKYWPGTGSVDISSYIPTTLGVSRWVLISFDPDPTSPTLHATSGTEQGTAVLDTSHILNITLPAGDEYMGSVRLTYGDTALTEEDFVDMKLWLAFQAGINFANNQHTHESAAEGGTLLPAAIPTLEEFIEDVMGAAIVAGANISVTYNDGAGTITIAVTGLTSANLSDFSEAVDDRVAALVVAGNNIDVTYNDGTNTLTIDVEALTSADITDFAEAVDDRVSALLVAGTNITLAYNDGANTLTITAATRASVSAADVSNPPTDAELDTAFGTPATAGTGFMAVVNDNDADTTYWLIISDGESWLYNSLTKAV